MTKQEAIEELKTLKNNISAEHIEYAIDLAIEALEGVSVPVRSYSKEG